MTTDEMVVDVSQDWAIACNVQERFMQHPSPTIDTVSYGARCRQIRALGGDCYDFLPLSHNRLGLAIGDASGKSLAAALMISSVQSSLRTAAFFVENDPAAVIKAVNRQVYTSSLADRYATLFYGVLDSATRTLRYVNAGHNPPVVIRHNRSIDWLEASGAPVGIFPDSSYGESVVQLYPGDVIIAYTDGVIETTNLEGEEFGVQGLLRATVDSGARRAEDVVELIFQSIDAFSQGRQTDDAAVVVVKVDRTADEV